MHRLWIKLLLVCMVGTICLPLPGALAAPRTLTPTGSSSAPALRAAYLYDSATAAETATLTARLAPQGILVTPIALATALTSDLLRYDLLLVSDESAAALKRQPELRKALNATPRPLVGLGLGGAVLFDAAGLRIGLSNLTELRAQSLDLPASAATRTLLNSSAARSAPLTVYSSLQGTLVGSTDRQPRLQAFGTLSGAASTPLLVENTDRALWGFRGPLSDLTAAGEQLLGQFLWQLVRDRVEIPLATGTLTPAPGIDPAINTTLAGRNAQYALVQLYHLPTPQERQELAASGVVLLGYVANTTYSARIEATATLAAPTVARTVRFIGSYRQEYKVDPQIAILRTERLNPDAYQEVIVTFFPDVSQEQIKADLALTGGVFYQMASDHEWAIANDQTLIDAFARLPEVSFIGAGLAPYELLNDQAKATTRTDLVQNALVPGAGTGNPIVYQGLTGQGVMLGHMESEPDTTHPDLAGRIILGSESSFSASGTHHSTHTSGTIISSGGLSESSGGNPFAWRGHAPRATLVNEGAPIPFPPTAGAAFADNFADAILNHEAAASSHSTIMNYGLYDGTASSIDLIVRGQATDGNGTLIPARLPIWAAGNNGTSAGNGGNEEGFYSVYSPAKNSLTVGSTDTADGIISDFSSRGPTFDGRIKPDLVAPGCQESGNVGGYGIDSTVPGATYEGFSSFYGGPWCGTSMATPAVAGITALMLEQYRYTYGATAQPRPSSLKALLVNTTVDMVGTTDFNDPDCACTWNYAAGPDWTTGYGMVDAVAAVNAVRTKALIEDQVAPADLQDEFTIEVGAGRPELRFTLAWDDEPGNTATNQTNAKLVNDLDLVLIAPDGVTQHLPWVLDALPVTANPGNGALDPITQANINNNPAYRDVNVRDNVEQVLVNNPVAGTWTVRVTASALPNGNAQPYSLAGDFRELELISPVTASPANAGDPNNPDTVLVIVEARQPFAADQHSSLIDATASDFDVFIGGNGVPANTPATIINGLPVGDQFWLMVQPQGGLYDPLQQYTLSVEWATYGSDDADQAVQFSARQVTDRAIVLDYSGSMSDYDKMEAAQNAARLFIDQSLIDDRIAVVGFSTTATTPYPSTIVAGSTQLNAAKTAVDSFSPTSMTAIGQGLLAGQTQVTAAPANYSANDVLILLSDGMENVAPMYADAAVAGVIEPTDTIVHTVAVGPSNAGHHTLLSDIATANNGNAYVVTTGSSPLLSLSDASLQTTGVAAQPTALPNRLGDTYKAIAEDILHEQRLLQVRGLTDGATQHLDWKIEVVDELPYLTVAVNWANEKNQFKLTVTDPDGNVYSYERKSKACRTDRTHETCIIERPVRGTWYIELDVGDSAKGEEYVLWASANTSVNFNVVVATPEADRTGAYPLQILAFLDQGGKGLGEAEVLAVVYGSGPRIKLPLFDDGQHGDGDRGDGIYGNSLNVKQAGGYTIRAEAVGKDHEGQPFELFDTADFNLRTQAVYVYRDDQKLALSYRDLLQQYGITLNLVNLNNLEATDLRGYAFAVIGPDTGVKADWGTQVAYGVLKESQLPILGLGDGGSAFFGQLDLSIGYPNATPAKADSIVRTSYGDQIWVYPHQFGNSETQQLYRQPSRAVDVKPTRASTVYGYNRNNTKAMSLMQEGHFMLWSYNDGPRDMTPEGQQLFVNSVYRLIQP